MDKEEIYNEIIKSAPTTKEFHEQLRYINLMKCPLTRKILINRAEKISEQLKNGKTL